MYVHNSTYRQAACIDNMILNMCTLRFEFNPSMTLLTMNSLKKPSNKYKLKLDVLKLF